LGFRKSHLDNFFGLAIAQRKIIWLYTVEDGDRYHENLSKKGLSIASPRCDLDAYRLRGNADH
jgi:hypothetical protein